MPPFADVPSASSSQSAPLALLAILQPSPWLRLPSPTLLPPTGQTSHRRPPPSSALPPSHPRALKASSPSGPPSSPPQLALSSTATIHHHPPHPLPLHHTTWPNPSALYPPLIPRPPRPLPLLPHLPKPRCDPRCDIPAASSSWISSGSSVVSSPPLPPLLRGVRTGLKLVRHCMDGCGGWMEEDRRRGRRREEEGDGGQGGRKVVPSNK